MTTDRYQVGRILWQRGRWQLVYWNHYRCFLRPRCGRVLHRWRFDWLRWGRWELVHWHGGN